MSTMPSLVSQPLPSAQISGVVFSGFGLSALPFSALQSLLINPANVAPQPMEVRQRPRGVLQHVFQDCRANVTCPLYFRDPGLLASLPGSMLTLSAVYTALLVLGVMMAVEKPQVQSPRPRPLSYQFCLHRVRRQVRRVLSEKDLGTP